MRPKRPRFGLMSESAPSALNARKDSVFRKNLVAIIPENGPLKKNQRSPKKDDPDNFFFYFAILL